LTDDKLDALVDFLSKDDRVRTLCKQPLPPEYNYASLSTMVMDAIFSISVNYGQVKAVVARHARFHGYDAWHQDAVDPYPLPELIREGRAILIEDFAGKLGNRCRTSTRNGILKAEAVLLVAEVLIKHGIVDRQSWRTADATTLKAAERDFRAIKGQGTGVSWRYLSMLAGNQDQVKPDRMVIRYVTAALGHDASPEEAGALLIAAADALRGANGYSSTLTARHLDYAVWSVARAS
jgi:hypothetical protein